MANLMSCDKCGKVDSPEYLIPKCRDCGNPPPRKVSLMETYNIKMKYLTSDFVLERTTYPTGGTALIGHSTGGDSEVLSINLVGYGLQTANPDQFYAKNYSEHEGLPDALVEAGIATKGPEVTFGYGRANLMTLLPHVQTIGGR